MEKLKPLSSFDECLNISLSDATHLPRKLAAVYIIYVSPNIALYVGKTVNLRTRARDHYRLYKGIKGARLAWFPIPTEYHRSLEKALIAEYQPVTNFQDVSKGALWICPSSWRKINRYVAERKAAPSLENFRSTVQGTARCNVLKAR